MTKVKTLLLTRPEAQSRALAKDIEEISPTTKCLISPLLEIAFCGEIPDTSGFQALIFTSVNGVDAYAKLHGNMDMHCYCVGTRTADAARAIGLKVTSANGTAADIVAAILQELTPIDGPVLHIRGEHSVGDIVHHLAENGFEAEEIVVYQQKTLALNAMAREALQRGEVAGLPVYSPRTARLLAAMFAENPTWSTHSITALCISENVAAALGEADFGHCEVAEAPNGAAMLSLIERFCAKSC